MTRKRRKQHKQPESSESRQRGKALASVADVSVLTREMLAIYGGLVVLIAIVYAQVRHFTFVFLDDHEYVVDNLMVRRGWSLDGLHWAFTTWAGGNWHPLTWLSHMTDVAMYGLDPGGHHVTSVVFHVMNCILLFTVLHRITGSLWRSTFVAAVFAIHPLHVESVAWVSERKDVLSTFFWMLTLHAYVNYVRERRARTKVLVIGFFALGLMSKPMLVTLPFTLLLLDYWPLRRVRSEELTQLSRWIPFVQEKLPLFVVAALSIGTTVAAQQRAGAVAGLAQLPMSARLGNAITSYVEYIRDIIWPTHLAAFYPFHLRSGTSIATASLLIASCTYLVATRARSRPYLLVGWLWYLGTLLPTIGIIQVGDQARADRYMYVPMIGLLIVAAWGSAESMNGMRRARYLAAGAGGAAVVALSGLSVKQASYWKSNLSLFGHAVEVTVGNHRAESLLGVALADAGRLDDAIQHYNASLKIAPTDGETHNNLGSAFVDLGRLDDALREYTAAVNFKPGSAVFRYNRGAILNETGRTSEAITELRVANSLDPGNRQYIDALRLLTNSRH